MFHVSISLRVLVFTLLLGVVTVTGADVARGAPAADNVFPDHLIQFQTQGQDVAHDINVADNRGGLRLYGCPALTTSPECAAIQFFGTGSSGFPGQLFIDAGRHNDAAIIFRTVHPLGPILERMRIDGNTGFVGINTQEPFTPLDVKASGGGTVIRAYGGDIGVSGVTTSGRGVEGSAPSVGGGTGVFGGSNIGTGVHGEATCPFTPNNCIGVYGTSGGTGLAAKFEGNVIITGEIRDSAGTCYAHCAASDERLKKDIHPLGPILASLLALQPVEFAWRTDEFPDISFSSGPGTGLLAQDVEHVLPELVTETAGGYKGVRYDRLPLLLLQGLKDLAARNAALDAQVQDLQQAIGRSVAYEPAGPAGDAGEPAALTEQNEALSKQVTAQQERIQALEARLAALEERGQATSGQAWPSVPVAWPLLAGVPLLGLAFVGVVMVRGVRGRR
jgi:hypothetical protein